MKIVCLIDSLNSGGAQRQMVNLAALLQSNPNHDIHLITYHDYDHYLKFVQNNSVTYKLVPSTTLLGRFWNIRSEIKRLSPDAIISFLHTPNYLGIVSGMWPKKIPVLVSERNFDIAGVHLRNRIRMNSYRFATRVVTNSYSQEAFIKNNFPFLKSKLSAIPNCVDLDRFQPDSNPTFNSAPTLRIVGVGSLCHRKNIHHLIEAVDLLDKNSPDLDVTVDWYGSAFFKDEKPTADSEYYFRMLEKIDSLGLKDRVRIHEPVKDIERIYRQYDACCLPSFKEGYPNVVCEAMACGLPVLASTVSDNPILLKENDNFLFDPNLVNDIAEKIKLLAMTDVEERKQIGINNRKYAEREFTNEVFLERYEQVLNSMVSN